LTHTIRADQEDHLVSKLIELVSKYGDGIDFDFEHMSDDATFRDQQLKSLASVLKKLRTGLDAAGHVDKIIVYTTRFNAFYNSSTRPAGWKQYKSDGEGIQVDTALKALGTSLQKTVTAVNIMMYDVPPADLGAPGGFTKATYKTVLAFFEKHLLKNQIVMGFEPGGQAAGGKWEGMAMDISIIEYVQSQAYGGVMFWAINQPAFNTHERTGENSQALALYSGETFQ
jgi:hypothetical protein